MFISECRVRQSVSEGEKRTVTRVEMERSQAKGNLRRPDRDVVNVNDRLLRGRSAGVFLTVVDRDLTRHAGEGNGKLA